MTRTALTSLTFVAATLAVLLATAVSVYIGWWILSFAWLDQPSVRLGARPGDGNVTLTWTKGGNFDGITGWKYRQRNTDDVHMNAWTMWGTIPGGADVREYIVGDLTNGQDYTFQLQACPRGAGATSNRAGATPSGMEKRLTEIRNLLAARDLCHGALEHLGEVYFDVDSFETSDELQQKALQEIAEKLKHDSESRSLVVVEGHASADGNATYNLDLSEDRAGAVINELWKEERGLPMNKLDVRAVSLGERHGRAYVDRENVLNRRVRVLRCTPVHPSPHTG